MIIADIQALIKVELLIVVERIVVKSVGIYGLKECKEEKGNIVARGLDINLQIQEQSLTSR